MPTTATNSGAALHAFIQHRMVTGEKVYAVVDAARDRGLAFSARDEFGLDAQWLFQGATPERTGTPSGGGGAKTPSFQADFTERSQARMAEVAPYLVAMPMAGRYPYPDCGFLDRLALGLGRSVGILLLTHTEPDPLARHLRTLFYATGESGSRFYFRFYDPRVLRVYLPTCTAAEATEFFGPIRRILCESESPERIIDCRSAPGGVRMDEGPITGDETGHSKGGTRR
jgi:hypothetical protein